MPFLATSTRAGRAGRRRAAWQPNWRVWRFRAAALPVDSRRQQQRAVHYLLGVLAFTLVCQAVAEALPPMGGLRECASSARMPEGDTIHYAARASGRCSWRGVASVDTPQPRHRLDRWARAAGGRRCALSTRAASTCSCASRAAHDPSHLRMGAGGACRARAALAPLAAAGVLISRPPPRRGPGRRAGLLELMTDSRTRFDHGCGTRPDVVAEASTGGVSCAGCARTTRRAASATRSSPAQRGRIGNI